MTTSSNPHPPPGWASRVLFRTGGPKQFCWFNYPGLFEPKSAEVTAHRLLCEGLNVLVCTSDEFELIGLPRTYDADEYFAPA